MNQVWLNTLEKLSVAGELSSSKIPKSIREEVELWGIDTGAIGVTRRGRGLVFSVINHSVLANAIGSSVSEEEKYTASPRANNLARYADTKVGDSRHSTSHYFAKAFGSQISVICGKSHINLSEVTSTLGSFAVSIDDDDTRFFKSKHSLLLVENQALFDHTNWIEPEWNGILLYYAGNISERLLSWLVKSEFSSITLFPDYDGVGLSNFSRLQQAIPRSKWLWKKDWESALIKYGNSSLWQKEEQRKQVDRLSAKWTDEGYPDNDLKNLIYQMRIQGKMLEQEWVLINS
jgi:hypothetical protein